MRNAQRYAPRRNFGGLFITTARFENKWRMSTVSKLMTPALIPGVIMASGTSTTWTAALSSSSGTPHVLLREHTTKLQIELTLSCDKWCST